MLQKECLYETADKSFDFKDFFLCLYFFIELLEQRSSGIGRTAKTG